MSAAASIDLTSLSDSHLQGIARAYYASSGEGASGDEADLEVCQAVAAELTTREIQVVLPWDHGDVAPDGWLLDVRNLFDGGM
jgi:hypothetical protein